MPVSGCSRHLLSCFYTSNLRRHLFSGIWKGLLFRRSAQRPHEAGSIAGIFLNGRRYLSVLYAGAPLTGFTEDPPTAPCSPLPSSGFAGKTWLTFSMILVMHKVIEQTAVAIAIDLNSFIGQERGKKETMRKRR
ncbi:uncharacterized protein FTJAE_14222 [Fusarium tjaetaba]|uniref:Uncharacterized protein n=1 Tax=Fusarium tjaetaba TaxID=1567544 RepID=A0A8H5Q9H0_9HYPO|nr:uncharacterized protein FTJAE_14222 [Fusarium tjaetaba]KAF5611157.1 hypothetical protein FTJAE_14222 [Fusarium tjaetaba]